MNGLLARTRDQFPNLLYCALVNKSEAEDVQNTCKAFEQYEDTFTWIGWFLDPSVTVDWLRVVLTDNSQLYFKRLRDDYYIVAYNDQKNYVQVVTYFENIDLLTVIDNKEEVKSISNEPEVAGHKMLEALRIQNMIIPRADDISKKFKDFFVVHQQQDVVGGDFYWFHETENVVLLALIDCTGHSLEGAMTSMVCNTLLNQSLTTSKSDDPFGLLSNFYNLLNKYNETSKDLLDYGIGAEIGLFCFDYGKGEVVFASTGISAIVKKTDGTEFIKAKKLIDYSQAKDFISLESFKLSEIEEIYSFTDGLPDQFGANDKKKLGRKGVMNMVKNENTFSADYYQDEISKWKGDNMQYDDITMLGMAL